MSDVGSQPWVVIKLGGTSTASAACWQNAVDAINRLLEAGRRVLVVHSALAGVTDLLERLWTAADKAAREALLDEIEQRHSQVAQALGVEIGEPIGAWTVRLARLLDEPAAHDDSRHAAVLAAGELMASELVSCFLQARGLANRKLDARDWLQSREVPAQSRTARYLSALCEEGPDPTLARRLAALDGVLVTQGFIARNPAGETVVLGRGGSDTSAAYFAARLGAERLEIWTDVAGLFTADPRDVPSARLLQRLTYAEAQEIATSGAKVLHPRSIGPVRRAGIPVRIVYAPDPTLPGTVIEAQAGETAGRVKAVCVRHGVTLVSMETVGMWHEVGFLVDAFERFRRHGLSVDMVSTSETSVTVTLDPLVNPQTGVVLDRLLEDLAPICRARATHGCTAVSLVGRHMRSNLHRLAPALEVFEERRVHLVSQAANDLNFTFVVDEADSTRLVKELHSLLIHRSSGDTVIGPTWEELHRPPPASERPWWHGRREALLSIAGRASPVYVYERQALEAAVAELAALSAPDRIYFAVKANCHPDVLAVFRDAGLGFECVSPGEIRRVLSLDPAPEPERVLYTPNFAPREDYATGLQLGVWVTLDNLHPLTAWPELFEGRELLLRVDPGSGAGHHRHVRTGGAYSKFGIPLPELGEAKQRARDCGARVVGLHMHRGSGILDAAAWRNAGRRLAELAGDFPDLRILDLGGGLGVAEKPADRPLDLGALDAVLEEVKAIAPHCALWLEPGRFLVARAGVLLTRVTQLKGKGEVRYVGADTGMNSLIRPALYGAHHEIVNLSRLDEPASGNFDVVGPICESGDVLGRDRLLPEPREGDVLLIANAGAYGRVMGSRYNLREPADEIVI